MAEQERREFGERIRDLLIRAAMLGLDPPASLVECPDGVLRQLEELVAKKEQEVAAARHARARTRPRFVIAEGWGHIFSEARGDTDTRWVFDRHRWHLVTLHIWEPAARRWVGAFPKELADVEDSLVTANEEALWDCGGWDLLESDDVPGWAAASLPRSGGSLLEVRPQR